MTKQKYHTPLFLILLTGFVSLAAADCTGKRQELTDGTYRGTFTVRYGADTRTGETQLELKDGTFRCAGNPDKIPAGGSGTFSAGQDTLRFYDENMWTADFDWNLILNGAYRYTFDGKKLVLFTDKESGYYTYHLRRE